ncbi:SH3 domain-containing protein [Treponema sp. OMZ 840]|uniref:SH3 domain-containing protein n=1 Tax=Treponema sp. OMZ 840 TaxID=244313 RepID=UPI003D920428
MREFLDYYDKLYISVQNLFDMKLPLNTTAFYTQAHLNILDKAGSDGTKLSTANKGTQLRILELGAKEKIDGITASWVKVRLQDGTEGWCFSRYLTPQKP